MGTPRDDEIRLHRDLIAKQLQDVLDQVPGPQHQTAIGFLIHKIAELHVELADARSRIEELDQRTAGQIRLG